MHDAEDMRTTLDLDEDILQAAKEIAANRGTTAGRVISELAREALTPKRTTEIRNGVRLMPKAPEGTPKMTMADVNRLRDEE